jgi:aspartate/methionine/tyrosine aminotransferase
VTKILANPPPGGRIRLMWTCYPNAPTGRVANLEFYERLLAILRRHEVILVSDEAYADFVYEGEQVSPLQVSTEGVIAFYSLSKRSNMTGYRVGWAAGDRRLVGILLRVKTNMDSGTPQFVQAAAAAALEDEAATSGMSAEYRTLRDRLVDAFGAAGCERCVPQGAIYVWQRTPGGMSSAELAPQAGDRRGGCSRPYHREHAGGRDEPRRGVRPLLADLPSREDGDGLREDRKASGAAAPGPLTLLTDPG